MVCVGGEERSDSEVVAARVRAGACGRGGPALAAPDGEVGESGAPGGGFGFRGRLAEVGHVPYEVGEGTSGPDGRELAVVPAENEPVRARCGVEEGGEPLLGEHGR